jgi:hypothetical protein
VRFACRKKYKHQSKLGAPQSLRHQPKKSLQKLNSKPIPSTQEKTSEVIDFGGFLVCDLGFIQNIDL